MALQRYIETSPAAQPFNLIASAPFAGPYSLPVTWEFLQSNPRGASPLALHLVLSYRGVYGYNDTLSEIFIPPYDTEVESIDDGNHNGEEMFTLLPTELSNFLQANFLNRVNNKTHPFYNDMVANNTYDFAPKTPTRLYHAINDELLPHSLSVFTCEHMKSLGAKDVEVVTLGSQWGHESSFIPSTLLAKRWFDTF